MSCSLPWEQALERVADNRGCVGVDGESWLQWTREPARLKLLRKSVDAGAYRPKPLRLAWIERKRPDGTIKRRPLLIASVADRIIQTALALVLTPLWEPKADPASFAYRPGRGVPDALRAVERAFREGFRHALDADIQSFFDSIPHERLRGWWRAMSGTPLISTLCHQWLEQANVWDGERAGRLTRGIPQGSPLSPPVANRYLAPLDRAIRQQRWRMIRYADDFLVLTRTAKEAALAFDLVASRLSTLGLTLHPSKTQQRGPADTYAFLGARISNGRVIPAVKPDSHDELVFLAPVWTPQQTSAWESGRLTAQGDFLASAIRPPSLPPQQSRPARLSKPQDPDEYPPGWRAFCEWLGI